jgi:hypothetical protein
MTSLRTKPDTVAAGPRFLNCRDGLIRALTPAPARETIADSWRHSQIGIREDIRFIGVYRKVLAEKNARLASGHRIHSAAYVEACRVNLDTTCKRYLRRVRQITEAEEQMTAMGIAFAASSEAWTDAELCQRRAA